MRVNKESNHESVYAAACLHFANLETNQHLSNSNVIKHER